METHETCAMMKDVKSYDLLAHNTFGIAAKCRRFVEYSSIEEARQLVCSLTDADRPLLLLGGGSNLLLTGDYDGTVLHSAIKGCEAQEDGDGILLRCGSGEVWDDVVALCVAHGWHGAENLSLIPGEVGASAVQNIGAYGAEVKDLIETVEAVEIKTGNVVTFKNEDCHYAYRQSRFKNEWKDQYLITYVTYRLSKTFIPDLEYGNIKSELEAEHIDNPTADQLRRVIIKIRESKLPDPKVEGNGGSFFMNPIVSREKFESIAAHYETVPHYDIDETHVKIPAGWMIDQCGWKGRTMGRAGVHAKQALVLVNRGGATGAEVLALCDAIRKDVSAKFGIDLQPEVNIR